MARDVKFNIKLTVDGKEHLITASTNVKKLSQELGIARDRVSAFRDSFATLRDVSVIAGNAMQGLRELSTVIGDWTAANAVQVEAETKLATVMRQRMSATEDEITSIKELASAQQQLGVIGDEVQLAGAQQMATFLNEASSIQTLLPAMNNLIAQQKGLTATSSDAVSIGNLLGKAMQGQTSALTRVGITFTDAQEQVMKFGTEEQRATMLAQIITDNVGEMNAALAATDAGQAKQLSNAMGDLKEQVGSVFSGIQPVIAAVGQLGMAITALTTIGGGIKSLGLAFVAFASSVSKGSIAVAAHTAATKVGSIHTAIWTKQAALARLASINFANGCRTAAIQAVALRVAIVSLECVTVIGAAIAAVGLILSAFANKAADTTEEIEKATDAMNKASGAADEASVAYGQANAELVKDISTLKEFSGSKEKEAKLVEQMNAKYGEAIGYYSSVKDWYEALTKNSELYCQQMVKEAQIRDLVNKAARARNEAHSIGYSGTKGSEESDSAYLNKMKEAREAEKEIAKLTKESAELGKQLHTGSDTHPAVSAAKVSTPKATAAAAKTDNTPKYAENSLAAYEARLNALKEAQRNSDVSQYSQWQSQIDDMQEVVDSYTKTEEAIEDEYIPAQIEELDTLAELSEAIEYYRQQQENASADEIADIQETIDALEKKKSALEVGKNIGSMQGDYNSVASLTGKERKVAIQDIGVEGLDDKIKEIDDLLNNLGSDMDGNAVKQLEALRDGYKSLRKEAKKGEVTIGGAWSVIEGTGNGISGLTGLLSSDANAWEKITGSVDAAVSIYQNMATLISMVTTLLGIHTTAKAVDTAAEVAGTTATMTANTVSAATEAVQSPEVASTKELAAAYLELAAAKIFAAHADIPFAGPAIAASFVAMMQAMVLATGAVAALAEGGVVSGPTLALVGEYSGASNNPEVIAPLDKLRSMMNTGGGIGNVSFRVRGRDLVGVLANETRVTSKSGKRTNIEI